jgi:transcriptional regulator with GAF, ATPase, and Fis domain
VRHLPLADELAVVFARMSGLLLSRETVQTALRTVSLLALDTISGAVGAGVTLVDARGQKESSGATDARVEQADDLQYRLGEGPCLAAAAGRHLVRLDDVATDTRWPRWSHEAASLGLHAALSAPLVAGGGTLGALKVYAEDAGTFDDDAERRISLFAAHAAVLVANVQSCERAHRLSDELRRTVDSRDLVSMAKGMLMAREAVDEYTAFDLLVARATQTGSTLHDAARSVVGSTVRRRRR